MGLPFYNSRDPWHLVVPGCHQVPSGVVVSIVNGKSRVDALLITGWQPRSLFRRWSEGGALAQALYLVLALAEALVL